MEEDPWLTKGQWEISMDEIKSVVGLMCLLLSGCGGPQPEPGDIPIRVEVVRDGSIPESPPVATILRGPVFTPFTVAPRLLNRDEVLRAREREFPPHLKAAGVDGTVRVWFLIDDEGRVLSRTIDESSGNAELDAAALRVAQVPRFSNALRDDEPVYVWISIPFENR